MRFARTVCRGIHLRPSWSIGPSPGNWGSVICGEARFWRASVAAPQEPTDLCPREISRVRMAVLMVLREGRWAWFSLRGILECSFGGYTKHGCAAALTLVACFRPPSKLRALTAPCAPTPSSAAGPSVGLCARARYAVQALSHVYVGSGSVRGSDAGA